MFGVQSFRSRHVTGRIGCAPAVVVRGEHIRIGPVARVFENHSVCIQNIVSIAPLQEDVQVPVLIDKVVGESSRVFRLSVADNGTVVVGDFVGSVVGQFLVSGVTRLHTVGDSGDSVFQFV